MKPPSCIGTAAILVLWMLSLSRAADAPKRLPELEILRTIGADYLRAYAEAAQPDAQGAIGHNRGGFKAAGFQRHTIERIMYGVLTGNPAEVEKGVRVMEYTFKNQQPDGDFPLVQVDPKYRNTPGARAQALAFFFYDLGHSLLLLEDSDWFREAPAAAGLRDRVAKVREQAKASLAWLVKHEDPLRKDTKAANRVFIYASAYLLMGRVTGDEAAIRLGESFARTALASQTSEGFFPENGGFDSNYNFFSVLLALNLYLHLPAEMTSLSAALWLGIDRGARWQLTRIAPDGETSTEGNSRVRPDGEIFLGKRKAVDTLRLPLMLYYYAALSGNAEAKNAGDRAWAFHQRAVTR